MFDVIIISFFMSIATAAVTWVICSSWKNSEETNLSLKICELDNALKATAEEIATLKKEIRTEIKYSSEAAIPAKSTETEEEPEETVSIPGNLHTNVIRFMDYRKMNAVGSPQKKLQEACTTNKQNGIRLYIDSDQEVYLCAALGGAFGKDIGEAWRVTLANGNSFNVICAEYKHPIDEISPEDYGDYDRNYMNEECLNVIEFVIDENYVPLEVKATGTYTRLEEFGGLFGHGGDIEKMTYIRRIEWDMM